MNQLRTKPQGFGALEVVVICLVIAVIAAAGLFVFTRNKNDSKSAATPTLDSQDQKPPQDSDASSKTAIDPSEGGKYLVIKEWGVRVLLPDSLKGNAFYSLREFDEKEGRVEAASISSKLFQPECRDTAGDLGLDVIRTTSQAADRASYAYNRNILQAGNYSYHNIYGKEGCSKFLSGSKGDMFNELKESIGTVQSY